MIAVAQPIIGLQALGSFLARDLSQTATPLREDHQQTAQSLATVVGDLGFGYGRVSRQLNMVQKPNRVAAGTQRVIKFLESGNEKVANAIAAAIQVEPELLDPSFLTQANLAPELQEQLLKLFDSAPERGVATVFAEASVNDLAGDLAILQKVGLLQLVLQRAETENESVTELSRAARLKAALEQLQDSVRTTAEAAQQMATGKGWPVPVLNGVIGDTLAARNSPFAIEMELLGEVQARKICVFVHGICDSETAWQSEENPKINYGPQLQQEFGYDPLYLRYNSGLHISTNGQLLAEQIDKLLESTPEAIDEIVFIAHSMGGLVVRSACHYGQQAAAPWVNNVSKIFFLGTPHQGNAYEKLGNLTSTILSTIPNPVTWGISAIANTRSAAIKDLRYGYLLDEDWQDQDADKLWEDNRHPVPLLPETDHYSIAAALAEETDNSLTQYMGDGVILAGSARGLSQVEGFSPEHSKTIKGLTHLGLLSDSRVYQQIRRWFTSAKS